MSKNQKSAKIIMQADVWSKTFDLSVMDQYVDTLLKKIPVYLCFSVWQSINKTRVMIFSFKGYQELHLLMDLSKEKMQISAYC